MLPIKEKKCFHNRIKRNYRHGKKSKPTLICKDCNKLVTPIELKQIKRDKKRR